MEVYPQCVFCKTYQMNCPHLNSLMMEGCHAQHSRKITQWFFFKDCVVPAMLPAKVRKTLELNGVHISFRKFTDTAGVQFTGTSSEFFSSLKLYGIWLVNLKLLFLYKIM